MANQEPTHGSGTSMPSAADFAEFGDELTILHKPDGGTVYILGTCHVSDASASNSAALVRRVRPSTVVIELCGQRAGMLIEPPAASGERDEIMDEKPEAKTLAGVAGKVGGVFKDWTSLINMQYAALESGLSAPRAGGEFRAAAHEARELGAKLVLADRDVDVTTLRLKRLVPFYELLVALFIEDSSWSEAQAIKRHDAAEKLQRTSDELSNVLSLPHDAERDARLHALSTSLSKQADAAVESAIPSFADAVLGGLLRRFWCKEIIGEAEKQRLRAALDSFHRVDPLSGLSLPPTMRRILIDERDLILCDALKRQPGHAIVGVVGKGHAAGIAKLWEEDLSDRLPAALESPRPLLAPLAAAAAAAVVVPLAAYRSRRARYALGAGAIAVGGVSAWFVHALRDRLDFFETSQRRLSASDG